MKIVVGKDAGFLCFSESTVQWKYYNSHVPTNAVTFLLKQNALDLPGHASFSLHLYLMRILKVEPSNTGIYKCSYTINSTAYEEDAFLVVIGTIKCHTISLNF